jgi:alkanesulfonate monooxygenase SsuD/methylene tetrahydromethanopterin reductase-like flavin-dependent oxidoreductase (luciferase family)
LSPSQESPQKSPIDLGISLPVFTADPRRPLEVAARAAELGIHGVFSPDHLFPPALYPSSGPDRPALEPFSLLSAVAALHPFLRVGTLVARVTLRAPGLLAKQAAGLDAMSKGRAILGLGAGDAASRPEHERFGLPFPPARVRIAMLRETSSALRQLFAGREWPGGAQVSPMTGPLLPPGSPEIWIGGLSDAVVEVAAREADVWNGWGLDVEEFVERATLLRRMAEGRAVSSSWGGIALVGQDRSDLDRLLASRRDSGLSIEHMWIGTADQLREFVAALAEAGASWFVVQPVGPADRLDLIAETLREL